MTTIVTSRPPAPKVGILGGGFMAEVHAAAARAAGATLVGLASSTPDSGLRAAQRLGAELSFANAAEMFSSSDIEVVHICTPNGTHQELSERALNAGKHVICEKPLATSALSACALMRQAEASGRVAAVPFVYRFHPMVREARARIRNGLLGRTFVIKGEYLQDWLISSDDDDWRVSGETGGPSRAFADIGSHLCDLIEFVTDDRIARLSAVSSTVHKDRVRTKDVKTEDVVAMAFEMATGAVGTVLVSQVSAGRKNRLSFEISGENESYVFDQESPELLWIGRRDGFRALPREVSFLDDTSARYSVVPSGHPMGYQDAFNAFVADAYSARSGTIPDGLPTFADGYRAARLTEAVLQSAATGEWIPTGHDETAMTVDSKKLGRGVLQ